MSIAGNVYHYWTFTEQQNPVAGAALDQLGRTINAGTQNGVALADLSLGASFGAKFIWSFKAPTFTGAQTWDLTALPVPNAAASGTGSPIVTLALVKGVWISTTAADGTIVYFGNPGANGWTAWTDTPAARALVMPGLPFGIYNPMAQATAPWTVDATHRLVKIDAGAATVALTWGVFGA
jgi:hypothetical protein